jgi:hypothetical protein
MSTVIDNNARILEMLKKYKAAEEDYQSRYPQLEKDHKDEYVAIENKKVIDYDKDLGYLLERLKNKDRNEIIIEYVSDSNILRI